MKLIILAALTFLLVSLSSAQIHVTEAAETTKTASVTWDSTFIGSKTLIKRVIITNTSGSIPLIVALENDTVAGRYFTIPISSALTIDALVNRRFLRFKTGSSTAVYRCTVLR
jgi:hypothetical protein